MPTYVLSAYSALASFVSDHAAILSLLGLAFVVTMREELPSPFNQVGLLNWWYGWLHDALKTFVSFRSPSAASTASLKGLAAVVEPAPVPLKASSEELPHA